MDRDRWLAERRTGIGGSDAAAVLGVSPWRTPLQVYQEKRGEAPPVDETAAMRWGTRLEPVLREEYAERTGKQVTVPPGIIRHPKHEWMIATLDGVTADGRVVEIKTARTDLGWGEPGTGDVPVHYFVQVQHYMAVTGLPAADIVVLIGGTDYRQYEVPANKDLQDLIIEEEEAFWGRVQRGEPPPPTTYSDVIALFGRKSESRQVVADDDLVRTYRKLLDVRARMAELAETEEDLKMLIMDALGTADTLVDRAGRVLCTWRAIKPAQRLDAAALKAAHPEIYQQYLVTGEPSRRFLLRTQED